MRAVWKQVINDFMTTALAHRVELPDNWVSDDAWHRCKGGAYRLSSQLPLFGFYVKEGASPVVWRHDAQRLLTMAQDALIAEALAECPKIVVPAGSETPPSSPPDRSNRPRQRPRARAKAFLRSALATGPMGAAEIQNAAANVLGYLSDAAHAPAANVPGPIVSHRLPAAKACTGPPDRWLPT
jgi:hypothetical protein